MVIPIAQSTFLRIHALSHGSTVNGPGLRTVIHTQGCSLACPGCFNPATHAATAGALWSVAAIMSEVLANRPDGISISGGEPTEQLVPVITLLRTARAHGLSTLVFSGRTHGEIQAMELGSDFLDAIDVLVDGRFDPTQVDPQIWTGSKNQRIHLLSTRHRIEEFGVKAVEFKILPSGRIQVSGFPERGLLKGLARGIGPTYMDPPDEAS